MRQKGRINKVVIIALITLMLALTLISSCEVYIGYNANEDAVCRISLTNGTYMGHNWYIDENHMVWWDGQPYIRYGFTGSPRIEDVDKFIQLGFNQFSVGPSETEYVFSSNPEDHKKTRDAIDDYTTTVTDKGGTYFANLNALLPWKNSGKIADGDRVSFVERSLIDVTEYAGLSEPINVSMNFEISYEGYTSINKSKAFLFDFTNNNYLDISANIVNISWTKITSPENEEAAWKMNISFSTINFPTSDRLVLVPAISTLHETVAFWDFPALWKQNIVQYYQNSLEFFKDAYQKEGLRGMLFGDEIGMSNKTIFMWRYEDFNYDTQAMDAFHNWLKEKYGTIENLNLDLETNYSSFNDVDWITTPLPYESLEHLQEVGKTFGIYKSIDQIRKLNNLQNQFMFWFYGHWYAKYAQMAKNIIGNVPVFLTAWSTQNVDPLQIHMEAMLQGMDGLVRNSYGTVTTDESGRKTIGTQDLKSVNEMINYVQSSSGYTKGYFANEFYWVQSTDENEDNVQFKFPSKSDLKDFLRVMIDNGYRGFHMFIMDPSSEWNSQPNEPSPRKEDIIWFSELKPEILGYMLSKGTVQGEVKSLGGKSISNAIVLIKYSNNGRILTETKTDVNGFFSIPHSPIGSYNVPEGTYDITVIKTGYEASTKYDQPVTKGKITYLLFTIQPKKEGFFGTPWFQVLVIVIFVVAALAIFVRRKVLGSLCSSLNVSKIFIGDLPRVGVWLFCTHRPLRLTLNELG